MELSFTEKKSIRKNFGNLKEILTIPNLIEVQKKSYNLFLEKNSEKDTESLKKGLQKVFSSIFIDIIIFIYYFFSLLFIEHRFTSITFSNIKRFNAFNNFATLLLF